MVKKRLRLKKEVKEKIKEELIFIGFMIPMMIFEYMVLVKVFFK